MKISKGIKEVEQSAPSIINILAYMGIGGLVLGVITQLAGSGSIAVSAALLTFLNTTLGTTSVTVITALLTALTTIVSLIVVAVLWKFFGLGGKGKGKSM